MIGQLIIKDMLPNLDPAQFAHQKGISLQHYLVQMIDWILTDTDSSTKGEANAVIPTASQLEPAELTEKEKKSRKSKGFLAYTTTKPVHCPHRF